MRASHGQPGVRRGAAPPPVRASRWRSSCPSTSVALSHRADAAPTRSTLPRRDRAPGVKFAEPALVRRSRCIWREACACWRSSSWMASARPQWSHCASAALGMRCCSLNGVLTSSGPANAILGRKEPQAMQLDPKEVEEVAKTLYIRAVKLLPPDIKRGFERLMARGNRRDRPRRPRHHGREHRGRREAPEPAVPGHRHSDLQRHDRQQRRVRRHRDEGGDPPRLRARHPRASAALVGGASADPQERADLVRRRRADHQRRFRRRATRPSRSR